MLGGKVLKHRENIVPSRDSAHPTAKREINKFPSPPLHCLFSQSPGIPTGSSKASIVFRDLLLKEQEVDLRASKQMTVHLT